MVPTPGAGDAAKYLAGDGTWKSFEEAPPGNFLDLTDTPDEYTSEHYMVPAVNVASDALEFRRACINLAEGTIDDQATLDIPLDATGYSNFNVFKIFFRASPATDNVSLYMRYSDDGGATFEADAADYSWFYQAGGGSSSDVSDSEIEMKAAIGNASGEGVTAEVTIYDPAVNSQCLANWSLTIRNTTGAADFSFGCGTSLVAAVTTDVRLLFSSGNIAGARWSLVGMV
jgi:hypothetical protein